MVFDTWGGLLNTESYENFSLRYMQKIVEGIKSKHQDSVPITLFTKGGGMWVEKIAATGCDAIGLDWTIELGDAQNRVGSKVALQGNLDPCVLYASPERIREEAHKCCRNLQEIQGMFLILAMEFLQM